MKEYKYFVGPKQIVCEYEYRGKKFYGRATCHPDDTFDEEKGKLIARSRVLLKVAKARYQTAKFYMENSRDNYNYWHKQFLDNHAWFEDAEKKLAIAEEVEMSVRNMMNGEE